MKRDKIIKTAQEFIADSKKENELIRDNEKLVEVLKCSVIMNKILEEKIEKIKKEIDVTYEWCREQYSGLKLKGITEYVNKLKDKIKDDEEYKLGGRNI